MSVVQKRRRKQLVSPKPIVSLAARLLRLNRLATRPQTASEAIGARLKTAAIRSDCREDGRLRLGYPGQYIRSPQGEILAVSEIDIKRAIVSAAATTESRTSDPNAIMCVTLTERAPPNGDVARRHDS
jgi:hypothetical protein